MENLISAVGDIFSIPGMSAAFAKMFGLAILLGATLDKDGTDLRDWVITTVVFGVFFTYSLSIWLADCLGAVPPSLGALTMIAGTVYCGGLAIGWLVSARTRKYVRSKGLRQ